MRSITGGTVERMKLGPADVALIKAQISNATPEIQTQLLNEGIGTQCKLEPGTLGATIDQRAKAGSVPPSALQSHFEKAMVKFIEEQGAPQNIASSGAFDRGRNRKGRGLKHSAPPKIRPSGIVV